MEQLDLGDQEIDTSSSVLTLHTLQGSQGHNTMRISGHIGQMDVAILVDSRSTHDTIMNIESMEVASTNATSTEVVSTNVVSMHKGQASHIPIELPKGTNHSRTSQEVCRSYHRFN